MNEEQTKEWMKKHYSDLTDFDNLQFVKDCAEDGVKEYKQKVEKVIDKIGKFFEWTEEQVKDIKKELEIN